MAEYIVDRNGKKLKITRGPNPKHDFNLGTGLAGRMIANRVLELDLEDSSQCCHIHHDQALREIGVEPVMVEQDTDGQARVYAKQNGIVILVLERPSSSFYEKQSLSSYNDASKTNDLIILIETRKTSISDAILTDDIEIIKTSLATDVDAEILEGIDTLSKAKRLADSVINDLSNVIVSLKASKEQALITAKWNEKAALVADGFRCVCDISTETKKLLESA